MRGPSSKEQVFPQELIPLAPSSKREANLQNNISKKKQVRRKRPCRPCCFGAEEYLRCDIIFLLCLCSLGYAVITTLAPPGVGANAGPQDPSCQPGYFENKIKPGHLHNQTLGANRVKFDVCICPRETICARNMRSAVFLVLARGSAYFDYPLYVAVFLSKAKNLQNVFAHTYITEVFHCDKMHSLHELAGVVISFEVFFHGFWHLLRWALEGEISFLWTHITGITGLVALSLTPLIAWPMCMPCCKRNISFEVRKGLHYLSLVWGLVICFHAPAGKILYIMATAVGVYALDFLAGLVLRVHYIPKVSIERLGSFVEVTFKNPPGLHEGAAGYVYVCLPWVSKLEFHALSLVTCHEKPGHSSVCMKCVGDWTKKVHQMTVKPTHRPAWIYGPFPSPFMGANHYENIFAIASGVGITPAVNLAVALGSSRRVNVVWMVRDPEIIEFYLRQRFYDDNGWTFIFYTGKKPLIITDRSILGPMVMLFKGRPDLRQVVSAIIHNLECGVPLPEDLVAQAVAADFETFYKRDGPADAVQKALNVYTAQELFEVCVDDSHQVDVHKRPKLHKAVCTRKGIEHVFKRQVWKRYTAVSKSFNPEDHFQNAFEEVAQEHPQMREDDVLNRSQFKKLLNKLTCVNEFKQNEREEPDAGETENSFTRHDLSSLKRATRLSTHLNSVREGMRGPRESSLFDDSPKPSVNDDVEAINNDAFPPNPFESACRGEKQGKTDIARWCAVYCGGSKPVMDILQKIGKESGMHTDFESFNW